MFSRSFKRVLQWRQMLAALTQNFTIIRTTANFKASVFCNVNLQTQTICILACTYLFILTRQIVGLHVAYNTLYTDWKMQYYTMGWDMASCNINDRPVPLNIIFTTHTYIYINISRTYTKLSLKLYITQLCSVFNIENLSQHFKLILPDRVTYINMK